MGLHRCTEAECPFLGQATSDSCRCHKTDVQVLREQRDDMLAALQGIEAELAHGCAHYAQEIARTVLDKWNPRVGANDEQHRIDLSEVV